MALISMAGPPEKGKESHIMACDACMAAIAHMRLAKAHGHQSRSRAAYVAVVVVFRAAGGAPILQQSKVKVG